jgi:hypothetical protein
MADAEKSKAPAASGGGGGGQQAQSGGGSTQQQLDESRQAREAADQQVGPGGRVPLGNEGGGEVGTTDQPLSGVLPHGVAQAGGEESYEALVGSDPHAFASQPGQSGPEAVGSGAIPPPDAASAMQDRAAAGIPEPPKVGPVANVTLLDTPGGYQVVPGTVSSPDELLAQQAEVAAAVRRPAAVSGQAAGADVRVVAGPGSE